ncbi:MAG: AI-2E family transporter [Rhodobacteraceae bacterium]|nr:AI-2E family transporter [Paracoccaceae bacterium]
MALPARQQLWYWGIAAAVLCLALWFMGDVLLPFVLGGAIAYALDPLADWLERRGLSRVMATVLLVVLVFAIFAVSVVALLPLLFRQAEALLQAAPALVSDYQALLERFIPDIFQDIFQDGEQSAFTDQQPLLAVAEAIQQSGLFGWGLMFSSVVGLVEVVALMVIVPVVAVYMLLDWDRMVAQIDALLPLDHAPALRFLAAEIDRTLASFVRGMGLVCLLLGAYYAIALMLVGLQFGLVVGVVAGLLTFIPYVGALIGAVLAIGLGLVQFWGEWLSLALVVVVFVSGQFVEGNILTPRLVGKSVGLHPVWLIFSLSLFGSLFGFVGILVAVPIAAMIGVLVRYGIGHYQQSLLYRGQAGAHEPHGPRPPHDKP